MPRNSTRSMPSTQRNAPLRRHNQEEQIRPFPSDERASSVHSPEGDGDDSMSLDSDRDDSMALDSDMDAQSTTSSLSMSSSSSSPPLISKPPGEVGRPLRGGYNLQRALQDHGWDEKSFLSKRKFVHSLINKHLEIDRSIMFQDKRAIKKVVRLAKDRFAEFKAFKNAWPILDMCKMHLKYTSERERLRAFRRIAQAAKAPQTVRKRARDHS